MKKLENWVYMKCLEFAAFLGTRMAMREWNEFEKALIAAMKKYDKKQSIELKDATYFIDPLRGEVGSDELDEIIGGYFKTNKTNPMAFDMYMWKVVEGRQRSKEMEESREMLN